MTGKKLSEAINQMRGLDDAPWYLLEIAEQALHGEPGAIECLLDAIDDAEANGETYANMSIIKALAAPLRSKLPPAKETRAKTRDEHLAICHRVIKIGDRLIEENTRHILAEYGTTQPYVSTISRLKDMRLLNEAIREYLSELNRRPIDELNKTEKRLQRGGKDLGETTTDVRKIITRRAAEL